MSFKLTQFVALSAALVCVASASAAPQSSGGGKGFAAIPCSSTKAIPYRGATINITKYACGADGAAALEFAIDFRNSFGHATADDTASAAPVDTTPNPAYVTEAAITERYHNGLSAADERILSRELLPAIECGDGPLIKQSIHKMLMTDPSTRAADVQTLNLECKRVVVSRAGKYQMSVDMPMLFNLDTGDELEGVTLKGVMNSIGD